LSKDTKLFLDANEVMKLMHLQRKERLEKFPPNPPNDKVYHALMSGVMIENSFRPKIHEYVTFFGLNLKQFIFGLIHRILHLLWFQK
jgi:hypothetical protein